MFVVFFDPEEAMHQVVDWNTHANFLSGGMSPVGESPAESLLNPRALGFGREEPHYIPVYWEPGEQDQ